MRKVLASLLIISLGVGLVYADQSLEERLQSMAATNAKSYLKPFVTAFGTAMNSGWFFSAKPHKLLGFDLGVRGMLVEIPTKQKEFDFDVSALNITQSVNIPGYGTKTITLDPEFVYPNRTVPTVFGATHGGRIAPAATSSIVDEMENQLRDQGVPQTVLDQTTVQNALASAASSILPITTPPGFNLARFPMLVPQAAVGLSIPVLPIHLEIAGRYLPEIELPENIGKFKFYGLGGKLALDPFIPLPLFGIKIAAGAYVQKLEVGDIIESNHSLYSLQVSRDFSLLVLGIGLYGGIGKELSDFKVKYTYTPTNPSDPFYGSSVPIKFNMKGENDFRTTVGARIRLLIFNVNADYSTGADNVATVGLALTLR